MIGLISSLCVLARINDFGFIETPYRKVKDGIASKDIEFLSATEEDNYTIAQVNAPLGKKGDFIWRPGGRPMPFDAGDTVVGFKGGAPGMMGMGGGINITQNIDIRAGTADEISRAINENNKKLVEDIRRLVKL